MINLNRTIAVYALVSIFAFIFNKIYALFGHGVTSPWMFNMYLFLLISGVTIYTLIRIFIPGITFQRGYRLFYNLYNSGIAIFTNGMLLKGILEIAGGTSDFTQWFLYIGSSIFLVSMILFLIILVKGHTKIKQKTEVNICKVS